MQINITGFLQSKNAREFMKELWTLLISAQENIGGIPSDFLEKKKEEIKQRKVCNEFRIHGNSNCDKICGNYSPGLDMIML